MEVKIVFFFEIYIPFEFENFLNFVKLCYFIIGLITWAFRSKKGKHFSAEGKIFKMLHNIWSDNYKDK